jgi:hypothetical protein
MFAREFCIWARLHHRNVLPLIGIVAIEGMPALASTWMENGTMNEYLKGHMGASIIEVVRIAIISCMRRIAHNQLLGERHRKRIDVSTRP